MRLFTLAAIGATLMFALGPLGPSAQSSTDRVVCEDHPTEPWMCANLDDTYADWPFLFGLTMGDGTWDNGGLSWDSIQVDQDTVTSAQSNADYQLNTFWYYACWHDQGTKFLAGQAKMRAFIRFQCPTQVDFTMTVCLERYNYPYGTPNVTFKWVLQTCKSTTGYGWYGYRLPFIKPCQPTAYQFKWRAYNLTKLSKPGYFSIGSIVKHSLGKFYNCM